MNAVSELGRELGRLLRESIESLKTPKKEKIEEYKRDLERAKKEVREKIGKVIEAFLLVDQSVKNDFYHRAVEIIESVERRRMLDDIKTDLYSMEMLEDEIFRLESKLK